MSSPSGSAQGSSTDELETRRRRVMERLQARHAVQQPPSRGVATAALGAGDQSQFDELRTRVNDLMNTPNEPVQSGVLKELEDALAILPAGLQSRRFKEALNELKARLQQQLGGGTQKKKAFSFSSKQQSEPKSQQQMSSTSSCEADTGDGGRDEASGDEGQKPEVAQGQQVLKERAITLQSAENEFRTLEGDDGREVQLSGLRACRVVVPFSASAVQLKDLHNCTVLLAPVHTSIVVHECTALTLVAAAQQIRIHSSHQLNLHVAVRGALILEDCDGALLHPYKVDGVRLDWHNDNWCKVHDFNWLSAEQSPHWKLAPQQEWSTFSMQSCEPLMEDR